MKQLPHIKNSIKIANSSLDLCCRIYSFLLPHRIPYSPPKVPLEKIKKILIIQLFALGDLLLSLPLVKGLRNLYPNAEIDFWIGKNWQSLKPCLPYIDQIITVDSKNPVKTIATLKKIRKRQYDLVFVLYPVLAGSWLAFLSKAKYRVGYTRDFDDLQSLYKADSFLLTHPVILGKSILHDTERYLDLARHIGLSPQWNFPYLYPPPLNNKTLENNIPLLKWLQKKLANNSDYLIGINPNASWSGRRWPAACFAKLADLLIEKNKGKVLFFGASDEKEYIEKIISLMKNQPLWPGPTSLIEMASLINYCRLFISNDSGPMHMASAQNIPTLAIMGLTKVNMFHPWAKNSRCVHSNLPCSPCKQKTAIKCRHFSCIRTITVEEVFKIAAEMF